MKFTYLKPRKRSLLLKLLIGLTFICFVGIWLKSEDLQNKQERTIDVFKDEPLVKQNDIDSHDLKLAPNPVQPPAAIPSKEDLEERMRAEKIISTIESKVKKGLGERGVGVRIKSSEKKMVDEVIKKEAFNLIASDQISFNRSVPDTRDSL